MMMNRIKIKALIRVRERKKIYFTSYNAWSSLLYSELRLLSDKAIALGGSLA